MRHDGGVQYWAGGMAQTGPSSSGLLHMMSRFVSHVLFQGSCIFEPALYNNVYVCMLGWKKSQGFWEGG